MWAWVLDHDESTCQKIIHPLYITIIPVVRPRPLIVRPVLSHFIQAATSTRYVQSNPYVLKSSLISSVVITLRAYAYTGRKSAVLVILGFLLVALVGLDIWAFGFDLSRECLNISCYFLLTRRRMSLVITSLFSRLGRSPCYASPNVIDVGRDQTVFGSAGSINVSVSRGLSFLQ